MIIRRITEEDAQGYIDFYNQLVEETDFLLLEPGESNIGVDEQKKRIKMVNSRSNATIFIVEHRNRIIGHLGAIGGSNNRNKHCAYLVTGILKEYHGQGIGTKLFEELYIWSRDNKIHRLELTVMTHNDRGVKLYKKMGFEIEGTKYHSLYVNGHYVDEYYMSKIL